MTDWEKVKKLTDEAIKLAARNDPDAPLYSKEQLQAMGFKKVVTK